MTMVQLEAVTASWSEQTRHPSSGDEWDRGDSDTHWEVKGLHVANHGDLHIEGPVAVGDTFYVVYAIYSTGDSFGRDSRARIEFFTAHRDAETARLNERILDGATEKNGSDIVLFTDGGDSFTTYIPWFGYFESLDGVYCEQLDVLP